ncbi:MAG: DNA gyrase inhibitor YacG [Deltaproteobacteria bacterium]|nr:MAG: DNA gyrase inhibitor YacG [Deltaproteobacteria bacterium]
MTTPCASCRAPAALPPMNRWHPFCSERCRMIDLSNWLDGRYAVASSPADSPQTEPSPSRTLSSGLPKKDGPP